MKKLIFIVIFFVTLGFSFLHCAPYYAANALQKASVNQDIATLEKYIDFNRVRAKLKKELMTSAQKNYEASLNGERAAHSAEEREAIMDMVTAFMDKAIDDLVTPEHISGILAEVVQVQEGQAAPELTMGYSGQNHFMISVQDARKESGPVIFVLEEKNFYTWYVTEIVFPE